MNELLLAKTQTSSEQPKWVKQAVDIKRLLHPAPVLIGDELFIVGGFDWYGWTSVIRKYNETTQTLQSWNISQIAEYPKAFDWGDGAVLGYYSKGNTANKYLWSKNTPTAATGGGPVSDYVDNKLAIQCYVGSKIPANARTFLFCGAMANKQLYMINHATLGYTLVRNDLPNHGDAAMGCEVNGILYMFGGGGSNGTPVTISTKYNPSTNQLTSLANMPSGKLGGACIAIDKDTIHLIGGHMSTETTGERKTVFEYKISSNTWRVLPDKFSHSIINCGYTQNANAAYIVGSGDAPEADRKAGRIFKMTF